MSLRIDTSVEPLIRLAGVSSKDAPTCVRQRCHSPSSSSLHCKHTPRGGRKANTFATLTNTGQPACEWCDGLQNGSPRGRSVSLFSPRTTARCTQDYQFDVYKPSNVALPRGEFTFRRQHNGLCQPLLMTPTFLSSSMSFNTVDMLLKAESTSGPDALCQEEHLVSKDDSDVMGPLDLSNSSLSRRSSRSSSRSQRGRATDVTKREKSCFPSVCWSAFASGSNAMYNSADSTCATPSSYEPPAGTNSSCPSIVLSPMDRARRSPPPDSSPEMTTQSSSNAYTFSVTLPSSIQSEMITVTAMKGDRLDVVADAWHMERDCHYEWQIQFAPGDVDMSTTRARLDKDGKFIINVERRLQEPCTIRAGVGFRYRF